MDSIEIIIGIRKIVRSLNLESKGIQKEYGLSITQLLCLGKLQSTPDYQCSHKQMMDFLHLNSSTVTGIINRLEKRGYVIRVPSPIDKRSKIITLTAAGLRLLQEAPNVLHDRLAIKLDRLPVEDKEMIKKSLAIITSAMEIRDIEASPLLTPEEPID